MKPTPDLPMNRVPPLALLAALVLSACGPARTAPPPSPVPAEEPAAAPVPAPAAPAPEAMEEAAPPSPSEAPEHWHLLDDAEDRVPGISLERARRELLAERTPARTVVVAVIDSGVDTLHSALRPLLWTNPGEVPGTGRDDDGNGYPDDVRGWNFIGGADGSSVRHDTYELARKYARCTAPHGSGPSAEPLSAERCREIEEDFRRERAEAQQLQRQVEMLGAALASAESVLRQSMGTDSLTQEAVSAFRAVGSNTQRARRLYLDLAAEGITSAVVEEARTDLETRLEYHLNPSFDPRPIVGDDPEDLSQRHYGNPDVMGPDAKHGTHVAGIVAGILAAAPGDVPPARILSVRTVPDGDERDKDVANAIRYAVDNGAHVINMSFGKGYSPGKEAVDEAVRYADARGVLMVHAAGNDGKDVDESPGFPTPEYLDGGRAEHWIEVGASSWRGGDGLAAPFSNFGRSRVDVFAPGHDIDSAAPGGGYARQSGTSMAAPVVSGLAALLMAYHPELSAADVRRIILESATPRGDRTVVRPGQPGGGEPVPFGSLSATGGVVNAYAALRMAEQVERQR